MVTKVAPTPEQWDDVMQINLKSVFNMTKHVIRPMMKAKKGSIINMSSVSGDKGGRGQSGDRQGQANVGGFPKGARQVGVA